MTTSKQTDTRGAVEKLAQEIVNEFCGGSEGAEQVIYAKIETALEAERERVRRETLEEAAQIVDEWNDSIKNGDRVSAPRHIRASLGVAAGIIRAAAEKGASR